MNDRQRWSLVMGLVLIVSFILCCVVYTLVRYASGG
jgi:hypothetical protein